MLSGEQISATAVRILNLLAESVSTVPQPPAEQVWQRIEEIAPTFSLQDQWRTAFLKRFPAVSQKLGDWSRRVMQAEANQAARTRRSGVAVAAAERRNDKYAEARKISGKRRKFPDYDPDREQHAKQRRAKREMEAAIAYFMERAGWVTFAITITMPRKFRRRCKDYYDVHLASIRKSLERSGKVGDQLAYLLQTELTCQKDDLFKWIGSGVEHLHGFIALPQAMESEIQRLLQREFGEIGFRPNPDELPEKFAPVLLAPIHDASGWSWYCCKRIGAEPERARARSTGKRLRIKCGFDMQEILASQDFRGSSPSPNRGSSRIHKQTKGDAPVELALPISTTPPQQSPSHPTSHAARSDTVTIDGRTFIDVTALLDDKALAHVLGISVRTVQSDITREPARLPPGFKIGRAWRWRPLDVAAWLDEKAREAKAEAASSRASAGKLPKQVKPTASIQPAPAATSKRRGRPTKAEQIARASSRR